MLHICFVALVLGVAGAGDGLQLGARPVFEDSCRDSPMSLVQSRASNRGKTAASQPESPTPWKERYYFVGTHHKSGSQLLRDVMRHAFDTLGAPVSCHYNWTPDHKSLPESFITSVNHDPLCYDRMDIPIQWDNSAKLYNYQAAKGAATLKQLPIRGAHAVRKPKDMLISAYCYHHRGQEYGSPMAPWPEIMSMGPEEGLMAMWPVMSGLIQDMVDVHTNTSAEEMFPVRFEEITTSSEGFDDVVQRLFRFFFAPTVPESDLSRLWQAAKVEDLHVDPNYENSIADAGHSNDQECMQATQEAFLQLDPRVVRYLKDMQQQLGYSIENWPDPVTS